MYGNFSAFRALKLGCLIIVSGTIGLAGFFRCSRDNPFDPKSNIYIPGTAPEADFPEDTTTGFIRDSIAVTVDFSDTQALGGRTPGVTRLLFSWNGDSAMAGMKDTVSVSGSGSITVRRYFTASVNVMAYVRAQDNDGVLGPAAGMRLIVDEGKPKITVGWPVTVPADSVLTGDTLVVTASASDTNGTIAAYIWTLLAKDTATTDSVLRYIFPGTAAGMQTVYVRVIDDDGAVSLRDSVTIRVVARNDSIGPVIQFLSPPDNGPPVSDAVISVQVRVSDPSGVAFVNVKSNAATRISGTELDGVYQRVNIGLDEGPNSIIIQAMDQSSNYNQAWDTLHVTYQRPDNTPPSIAFSYPDSGETVYQSPVTVTVSVTDQSGVSWVICGSDTMKNPTGSVYTSNVAPVEGTNSLTIRARDTRGNTAVDTLVFTYVIRDKTPPVVHITSPVTGAHISADSVTVTVDAQDTGTYTSGIASVTVNGLAATLNLGVYTRTITLSHGSNTMRAVATDGSPAANQARDSVVVIQDRAPHFVPDTAVRDTGLWVDSTASITLNAVDPDGDPLIFSFVTNPAKASFCGMVTTGNSAAITYTASASGLDTFRVQVADSIFGDADTILVRVTNTMPDLIPPTIAFVTPLRGDTVRDTLRATPVTVVVSVTDPSGVAWVRCNDSAMSNTSGSSYRRDVSLVEGSDTLRITAEDTRANSKTDTLFITYVLIRDAVAPYVHITAPQNGERITAGSVTVGVHATDTLGFVRSGIDSVTINGAPAAFSAGNYTAVVALAHGYDTIRAMAVDSSGNRSRDSVIVLRNIPPQFLPDVSVRDTVLWLDSAQTVLFQAVDPDLDPIVFDSISWPRHNGSIPYLVVDGGGYAHLAGYVPNATGLDSFIVKVTDSCGASDTLKIRITVLMKPTTKPYFTISTLPDTALLGSLYSVQLTAVDPQSLPLSYSLLPPTPSGVSIVSSTGLVTWTPASLGRDTIVAMVSNTIPETDTLQWFVTVIALDHPPVIISGPVHNYVNEGQLIQFTHPVTDPDGDTLRFSFGASHPAGAVIDSVSGYISWTPGYAEAGMYLLVFKVTERDRSPALSDSVTDTITVANVNRPPVLVNPGSRSGYEDVPISFYLSASDPDNDQITFSKGGTWPGGADILNGNNFIWTPSTVQGGMYAITFIATDNGSPALSDTVTDTFTVLDTTKPVFGLHTALDTAWVGMPYTTSIHAVDSDGDSVLYAKYGGPAALTVNTFSGAVAWTPSSADAGYTFGIGATAADPAGNRDTIVWNIRVVVPDYPPVLSNPGNQTITESKTLQFTLVATDANNDALCYTFGGAAPVGATLDSVTGLFTWTPGYKQAGVYPVLFKVYERDRIPVLSDTASITITVKDTNIAPVFTSPPDSSSYLQYESKTLTIPLTSTNIDNDSLIYSVVGAPNGAGIVSNRFTWTIGAQQGRSTAYQILLIVTDNGTPALSDSSWIFVTVRDTTVPLFSPSIIYDTTYVQTQYSRTVAAVDNDDDPLAYYKVNGPAALTVDEKYGIVDWKPAITDTGIVQAMIRVVDHYGNGDTISLIIRVFPRWPRTYGIHPTNDTGYSVIQTSDGNYAVCGSVGDSAFFMKTDTSGNRLYFQTYGSTPGRALLARCIREIPANQGGGFIIAGTDTVAVGRGSQLFLMRIDAKGDSMWIRRFVPTTLPAPFNQFNSSVGASVCIAGTGNIVVACGTVTSTTGSATLGSAMYALQVDGATGTKVWEKAYYTGLLTTGAASAGYSIQQTIQKGFILSGEINQGGNVGTGVYLVRINASGDTLTGWTKIFRFSTVTGSRSAGNAVNEASDESGFFVCGYVYNPTIGGYSALVFKTSELGDTLGMWRYQTAQSVATGVRATQDGGCIVSGYRIAGTYGLNDAALWKMTAAGTPYFAAVYGTTNNDRAYDAAPTTPDGGYIFTGFSLDPGSGSLDNDIYLVKTDVRGAVTK